jgi:chromosome segregation protein
MTDLVVAPAPVEHDHGRIGERELVCVQTIDIGRLRSAPVPITPGTFVAVSGRGPKGDSNGSGKTTFLAALSLLHGEVGWRLAHGAPEAASLLFDGTKAGVDVARYARADHGYVIGVFCSREKSDPITVWLRINAAAPVLRVRAQEGIHLVHAVTSSARAATADAIWAALPRPEWGSKTYAHELYGATPRCMAWLQARGNETPGKSLLKLSQEMLTPEQIGVALLELLGRDDLIDEDRAARAALDATTREVEDLLNDDATRRTQEDDELRAIAGREQARAQLTRAEGLWHLHYAKGLIDATTRAEDARRAIRLAGETRRVAKGQLAATMTALDTLGDGTTLKAAADAAQTAMESANETWRQASSAKSVAQNQLDVALKRLDVLRVDAAAADGTPLDILLAAEAQLARSVKSAEDARAVAAAERERRDGELLAAEAGAAGEAAATVARLATAGVKAVALLDELEVDPAARDVWEPRLALYRDAVAIAGADLAVAVDAAGPGDTLIAGDPTSPQLPDGVLAAPPASLPFLYVLADADCDGRSARIGDHVVVVGGFEAPICGREARIATARKAAEEARAQEHRLAAEAERQQADLDNLRRQLDAARAAEELVEAQASLESLRAALGSLDSQENVAARAYRRAGDEHRQASEAWGGYAEQCKRLEEARERDEQALLKATLEMRAAIDAWSRQRDNLPYWSQRWGGDLDSARTALAGDVAEHPTGDDRSASSAYRRAANHAIDRALLACGIDSDNGAGAPAGSGVDLAVAERTAAGTPAFDDERGQSYERQATAFHAVADAPGSWLGRLRSEDRARAAHIDADRARRAEARQAAERLCEERRRNLPVLQDQIERLLRTSLGTVGDKLNALDLAAQGSGADLLIEPQRPTTARESWLWRVTPRYRRGPNGGLVPYTERANTATEKLLAIHLVLAALFAATAARGAEYGRVLILDELGDSLGDYHREAVLSALARTASEAGITVLGTCQDGVLEDAARHCGQLLYFQFRDASDVLNAPTRVFGTTHDGSIVEQTAPFIERLG